MVLGVVALTFLSLDNAASNTVNDGSVEAHALASSGGRLIGVALPSARPYDLKDGLANIDRDLLASDSAKRSRSTPLSVTNGRTRMMFPSDGKAFPKFAEWLKSEFPRVHEKLDLEKCISMASYTPGKDRTTRSSRCS